MAMTSFVAVRAFSNAVLLLGLIAGATALEQCDCKALRQKVAELEAEVKALRPAARRTASAAQCDTYITLRSDLDVQNFARRGCQKVFRLTIRDSVTSLTGLGNLTAERGLAVRDTLHLTSLRGLEGFQPEKSGILIEHNAALESLDGLESSTSLPGSLKIDSNPRLSSLEGLRNVRTISGDLTIEGNNVALQSLADLESLTSVGGFFLIQDNPHLSSLLGPWSLQVGGTSVIILNNTALTSITGFENVTTISCLNIQNNPCLSSLSFPSLHETSWAVWIVNNKVLTSLAGLENLTYSGELTIQSNPTLLSLTGLTKLTKVDGDLRVEHNPALRSLSGLEGLQCVGSVWINDNGALQQLNLDSLTTVVDSITIERNRWLSSLSELRGIRAINRSVIISENGLRSLDGLQNLVRVGGHFHIIGHSMFTFSLDSLVSVEGELKIESDRWLMSFETPELNSVGALHLTALGSLARLDGLQGLTYAWGGIFITDCSALASLFGLGSLYRASQLSVKREAIVGIGGWGRPSAMVRLGGPFARGAVVDRIEFDENQWPLCITPHERAVFVSAVPSMEFSNVPNTTWQRWNDKGCNRTSWQWLFKCTKGQPCSFPLIGDGSAVNQSVYIADPSEGCSVCLPHHLNGTVQAGGVVDLGHALSDSEAGQRLICQCFQTDVLRGPLAELSLRGPRRSALAVCSRGHNCVFQVDGDALEPTDTMVLMSSCDEGDPLRSIAASWVAENTYLLHDPATWYEAEPTRYELCWRAPCATAEGFTCPPPADKYFRVGELELLGAYSRNYTLVLGEKLSVPNIGFGTSDGDRTRLRRRCGQANEDGLADALEANSSGMLLDFGALTKDRARAGLHHLCWCQVHDGVQCTAEWDFNAVSGDVRILCPGGEELTSSGECRLCPAGKQRIEAGLSPCSECPAGQFAKVGDSCEACPADTFAELTGSSACDDCQAWESSDVEAARCSTNPQKVILLASFLFSVGAFAAMLLQVFRRRLSVVDVSLVEGRTIVTTFGSHGLSNFGRCSLPVTLHGTGHPGLELPFRARVQDAARLELLTQRGVSIDSRLDTSMGTLAVSFPYNYYHQGWAVPAAFSLPLLFTVVVVLGVLALATDLAAVAFPGAAATAAACATVSAAVRWWPRATPLEHRLEEFKEQKLPQLDRALQTREKGAERAISIGKLHELLVFFHDFIRDRTAYYMDQNIMQPLTRAKRLSYAELAGAGPVEWFVSHFWGTAFDHFCKALKKHAEMACGERSWTELRYWVCFCSNNQHHLKEELGDTWMETSFYMALRSRSCQGTCMVLDEKALPLTRIWCIFELLQTCKLEHINANFGGLLLCTSGGVLNTGSGSVDVAMALAKKVADLDLGTARASNVSDEDMIRDLVVKEMGSFTALNRFVRGEVRKMLVHAQGNASQQFSEVIAHLDEDSQPSWTKADLQHAML